MSGIEPEGGRGNICFPVEEGLGKPWVSQEFDRKTSTHRHPLSNGKKYAIVLRRRVIFPFLKNCGRSSAG
jgi:hypothetical protein